MPLTFQPIIRELLDDTGTTKIVATTTEDGSPYAVTSPFLHLNHDGFFVHLELLETSITNKNLLRDLWYDKKAAINLTGKDGRSFLIQTLASSDVPNDLKCPNPKSNTLKMFLSISFLPRKTLPFRED